ncbi:hypothetical protein QC761_213430 [Podospora bellae-mahoneyi]|uniref:Lipase n=1 Tax=Podospora bellae-mahoneyi TaxID=2093777 RepID=A0ABR0FS11_9PEZI|nr:hypothetical protein QC761_213430 [Podospora bellae-mahoneyi]
MPTPWETLFNIQRFAANGFAVIAADYIGKGLLREGRGEAYVVKGATTQTCVDILNAGLAALEDLGLTPAKLFLHGWSQGALNTLWLHQALRSYGIDIEATAVASPFSDLDQAWQSWSGKVIFPLPESLESYPPLAAWIAPCMIVALGSYEMYYNLSGLMETAVRPQYRELAERNWQDYNISAIDPSNSPNSTNLLADSFWKGYTNDHISALQRQLIINAAIDWEYDSSIRFYYGLADEAVHPAMVTRTVAARAGMPLESRSPGLPTGRHFLPGCMAAEHRLTAPITCCRGFRAKLSRALAELDRRIDRY